jgi:Coenzyme PQQ synthesis protein D (PqqD)
MSSIAAKDAKNKIVAAVKDQVSCALDGDTVILHLGSGTYYGLNAVGSTIWNLIQEARTIAEIYDRLLQQYESDAGECERDLLNVLDDLSKAGLVEIRDARTEEVS